MRIAAAARRRWVRWLGGITAGLLGLAGVILIGATYKPGWYRPATLAPDDYRTIRNELPSFGSAIGSCLERGQPFRIELTDKQVNRWLAARSQIWPSLKRILPPEIQDPVIAFQPDQVILAARYDKDRLSSILSLSLSLTIEDSGSAILIRLGSFHVGLVPMPRMFVESAARQALTRAIRTNWPRISQYTQVGDVNLADQLRIGPDQLAGFVKHRDLTQTRLPTYWVWPNGKFPFRVASVQLEQGKLRIDITPAPRQAALSDLLTPPAK